VARYRFLTTWLIEGPREPVWSELKDAVSWPEWWKGVVSVDELDAGDDLGVGGRHRIEWRSRIPYPLAFEFRTEEVDPPRRMAGRAFGELEGTGVWRLWHDGGITAVVYDWDVVTTKPWMNAAAPLARPVFAWNHNVVMRQGGEGLARRLGTRLVAHG
jgi:hypothetical protein